MKLFKKLGKLFGGELDMNGWFKQMEAEHGPVNTIEPGKPIPMVFGGDKGNCHCAKSGKTCNGGVDKSKPCGMRREVVAGQLRFELEQARDKSNEARAVPREVSQQYMDGFTAAVTIAKNNDLDGSVAMAMIFQRRVLTVVPEADNLPGLTFFSADGKPVTTESYLAAQAKSDRHLAHYTERAVAHGWAEEKDGAAIEFLLAEAYRTGHSDAINREGRVLVTPHLIAEAENAIRVLAERQPDNDMGDWWAKHYSKLANTFKNMLAKSEQS